MNAKILIAIKLALCIVAGTGSRVVAQETFTLEQALEYAYEHNTIILNAETDKEIARAQKNEVVGIGLPQVQANMDVQNYVELPTSLVPAEFFGGQPGEFAEVQFGTKYNATATVSANQLLFSGDYIVALQTAGTFLDLSEQQFFQSKIDVRLAVEKAFFSVLINQERYELLSEDLSRLEQIVNETRQLYEAGFAEKLDLDRLTVSYNNISVELENLSRLLGLSRANLKFQMGMPLQEEILITGSIDEQLLGIVDTELTDFSFEDRVEYRLLNTQEQLSEQNIKRFRYSYLPNLSLYGRWSAQAQRNEVNFFDSSQSWYPITLVGLTLSANIFDGLQREYKMQQARLELVKNQQNKKNLRQGIELEIENSRIMLKNSISSMENQKNNMELAQSVLETISEKYKAGTATSLELVEAEGELKQARTNYLTAVYNAIVAKIDFEKATGKIVIE